MVFSEFRFGNIGKFYARAMDLSYPICLFQPAGCMLSPQLRGSLHHILHPDQVVNRNSKGKHPTDTINATMPSLSQHSNWYCQANGSKDIFVTKCREACNPSMNASRLLPIEKGSASEESVVNCFEMVAANSEQVLN
jgi:hypothetical protein